MSQTECELLLEKAQSSFQAAKLLEVYERILKVPYYVVFDRYTDNLRVFMLQGDRYSCLELRQSRFWIPSIERGLGLWQGSYEGIERQWLRWFDGEESWLPTTAEREQQRVERLATKLRELGVDPDEV